MSISSGGSCENIELMKFVRFQFIFANSTVGRWSRNNFDRNSSGRSENSKQQPIFWYKRRGRFSGQSAIKKKVSNSLKVKSSVFDSTQKRKVRHSIVIYNKFIVFLRRWPLRSTKTRILLNAKLNEGVFYGLNNI